MTPLLWEVALGRLRIADHNATHASLEIKDLRLDVQGERDMRMVLNFYSKGMGKRSKQRPSDRWHATNGFCLLIKWLCGLSKTRSWGFPPVVVAVFFLLSFGLVAIGVTLSFFVVPPKPINGFVPISIWFITGAAVSMHGFAWLRFFCKLHDLMLGSTTTGAFAWQFLAIRSSLLVEHGFRPTYPHIGQELTDEVLWINSRRKDFWNCRG